MVRAECRYFRSATSQSQKFLKAFHKSKNLSEVSDAAHKYKFSPLAALYQAGLRELASFNNSNADPAGPFPNPARTEALNRALQRSSNQEIARMERMMNFLATTGSVTPFIGLFGTVWGIMDAFSRIGIVRSASLVTVAPGIAEALIATAIGLFAAVPAVIAYNFYLGRIKDVISPMIRPRLNLSKWTGRGTVKAGKSTKTKDTKFLFAIPTISP